MSDTPRTDSVEFRIKTWGISEEPQWAQATTADFARTLERENAELRGKLGNLAACAAEFLATGTEEHRSDLEGALDSVGAILNEGSK